MVFQATKIEKRQYIAENQFNSISISFYIMILKLPKKKDIKLQAYHHKYITFFLLSFLYCCQLIYLLVQSQEALEAWQNSMKWELKKYREFGEKTLERPVEMINVLEDTWKGCHDYVNTAKIIYSCTARPRISNENREY